MKSALDMSSRMDKRFEVLNSVKNGQDGDKCMIAELIN